MKILVVDADYEFLGLIGFALRQSQYLVIEATDGVGALAAFAREVPALVILDVNLPDMSGFAVCQAIRAQTKTPIMVLATHDSEADQAYGFDVGADDYLMKPFSLRIFLARVRALLRRSGHNALHPYGQWLVPLTYGPFILDSDRQEVRVKGSLPIHLTHLEFRLLHYLLVNAEQIVPFERLITHVWGYRERGYRSVLKQLVHRLRQKIERDPAEPQYVRAVAGIGYVLQVGHIRDTLVDDQKYHTHGTG